VRLLGVLGAPATEHRADRIYEFTRHANHPWTREEGAHGEIKPLELREKSAGNEIFLRRDRRA